MKKNLLSQDNNTRTRRGTVPRFIKYARVARIPAACRKSMTPGILLRVEHENWRTETEFSFVRISSCEIFLSEGKKINE